MKSSDNHAVRGAIYARVSSERQAQAGTIESQVAQLRERVQQDGLALDETVCFIDDGYSGSTLVRPALERLRDLAAAGGVDRLYVASPDRLARRHAYQVLLVDELQGCGVEFVFLNRPLGESPEDRLLLEVQGVVAEYERAKIMERCRRGKLHAAKRGSVSVMSAAPYGYRYVTRGENGGQAAYIIQMDEARVVRQMFEWMATEPISVWEVTRRLRKEGIPSKQGRLWWERNTVWHMLKNPVYKGRAAFGKTRCGERRSRLRPLRNKPEPARRMYGVYSVPPEQWSEIPVPAIVSEELFAAVQERLAENRRRYRVSRDGPSYLLQGLVVCRHCGYAMCGITVSPKTARQPLWYYRCIGAEPHRHEGKRLCPSKHMNGRWLEEAVWADVCQLLSEPRRVEAEYERRLSQPDRPQVVQERERQQAMIKKLERGIERLIDAFGDGLLNKTEFEPRIRASRERLAKLTEEVQSQIDQEALEREMRLVIGQLEAFADRVRSGLDQADWPSRRAIICGLVKRIEVEHDQVRVVYRIDPNPPADGPRATTAQDCSRRQSAFC